MPELPEVETVRRQLARSVVGHEIESVAVHFAKRLNLSGRKFAERLSGQRIESVGRRAKLVLIELSGGDTLVVHLKMTGKLLLVEPNHEPGRHTHIVFNLSGGRVLFFDDVRKFGYLKVYRTVDLKKRVLAPAGYGPEPLSEDFSLSGFTACLKSHPRAAIKPLLLSQKCVVGVGNIYSDETLWRAKIRPTRRAGSLTGPEVERLHESIQTVLCRAIRLGGTSVDDYRDARDRKGRYGQKLEAYFRDGQPCSRCGQPIRKIRLGGRGTHYCPKCQK